MFFIHHVYFWCTYKSNVFLIRKIYFISISIIVLYLPWLLVFLPFQIIHYVKSPGIVAAIPFDPPLPAIETVFKTFAGFAADNGFLLALFVSVIIYGFSKNREREDVRDRLLLLFWLLFPALYLYVVSYLIVPVYKIKIFLLSSIPCALLFAKTIVRLKGVTQLRLICLIAFFSFLRLYIVALSSPLENWQKVCTFIRQQYQPNTHIFYCLDTNYYLTRESQKCFALPERYEKDCERDRIIFITASLNAPARSFHDTFFRTDTDFIEMPLRDSRCDQKYSDRKDVGYNCLGNAKRLRSFLTKEYNLVCSEQHNCLDTGYTYYECGEHGFIECLVFQRKGC